MSALKFAEEGIVEGVAIPFGSASNRDRHNEYFTAETDVFPTMYDTRPVLIQHGLGEDGLAVVGHVLSIAKSAAGWIARCQLDTSGPLWPKVKDLLQRGLLSFSSGAIPHLVKTDPDGRIVRWPFQELSLTPTPSSSDARIYSVKAEDLARHIKALELLAAPIDHRDEIRRLAAEFEGTPYSTGIVTQGRDGIHVIQPIVPIHVGGRRR